MEFSFCFPTTQRGMSELWGSVSVSVSISISVCEAPLQEQVLFVVFSAEGTN
jgi:hypothetical protein